MFSFFMFFELSLHEKRGSDWNNGFPAIDPLVADFNGI